MSNALEKKVDKILDYLDVMTRENNDRFDTMAKRFDAMDRRFDTIDQRFDAVDEDMATIKGQVRRIDERLILFEKSNAILQDADRNRQDDIRQLDIRLGRVEDRLRALQGPPSP